MLLTLFCFVYSALISRNPKERKEACTKEHKQKNEDRFKKTHDQSSPRNLFRETLSTGTHILQGFGGGPIMKQRRIVGVFIEAHELPRDSVRGGLSHLKSFSCRVSTAPANVIFKVLVAQMDDKDVRKHLHLVSQYPQARNVRQLVLEAAVEDLVVERNVPMSHKIRLKKVLF